MKIRITDKNNIPRSLTQCAKLNGKTIKVGVFDDTPESKKLAEIHEYGCKINVTPAMRAHLHKEGLHLKKSTTQIVIPERSFIRGGYAANEKDFLKKSQDKIGQAVTNGNDVDAVLHSLGNELKGKIQKYAVDLRNPANHPFTVSQKGSTNPLVDSGKMINQDITFKVE